MKKYGVPAHQENRRHSFLLQNQTPEGQRGKNQCGNAIPGDICVQIREHKSVIK